MARNYRVLVLQLLGNRINPCAAFLRHRNYKHPLNFIKTLTTSSVPITPLPAIFSTSKPFSTLDSSRKKKIIFESTNPHSVRYDGISNIPLFLLNNQYDEYVSAVKRIQDESLPAIILFTTYFQPITHVMSGIFTEMIEPFPHVTAYEFLLDPEEDNYKSILENLNIPYTPMFHFYQNGKKVAEISRKKDMTEAFKNNLKKTLVKLYIPKPTKRSSGKEKRRTIQEVDIQAKKDKNETSTLF